uniref:Ensconsin n=1 Tax=Dicentrarchus labrax TaxID=13489 RepID=A0A8C4HUN6_DICLA
MAVQKKQSVIPPSQGPLSTRTVESQRKGNGSERTRANIKPNSQAKKTACSVNNAAQICHTATPRAAAGANGPNVDERLKAARERREEQQKLLASRELSRVEREQRARRYYEQQLQQRKKKLLEQRLKEERRRAAVEEKRKQRLKEDRDRYESAVRRTLEKSQRAQQNLSQNSRGRKLTKYGPPQTPPRPAPQPPEVMCRPSAGTTDPEEASRLLAEKRREARLQREKEEQERLQREEAERRSREELERRRTEERARQQAEAHRLIEEKRRREEEEQRRAEEERAQAMKEAALLQKQVGNANVTQCMKEPHLHLQAMLWKLFGVFSKKLTKLINTSLSQKSVPVRTSPNEAQPKENTEPVHNGTIEDAVKLPVGTKTSQLGLNNEEDMVPVVAFKERRSLRTLTGLEEIQTHQRAEVI